MILRGKYINKNPYLDYPSAAEVLCLRLLMGSIIKTNIKPHNLTFSPSPLNQASYWINSLFSPSVRNMCAIFKN